jgi:hypothetical protein
VTNLNFLISKNGKKIPENHFFLFLEKNSPSYEKFAPKEKKKKKRKGLGSRHKLHHIQFAIQI